MSVLDDPRRFPADLERDADAAHASMVEGVEAVRDRRFDGHPPDPRSADGWAEEAAPPS